MELNVSIYKAFGAFKLNVQLTAGVSPVALLGPAGSGKSAVLQCVAGLVTPDTGTITLDGEPLFDKAQNINLPPQKRGFGYLFPSLALFPHMTVRQNIAAGVQNRTESRSMPEELIRRFRLEDAADKRPAQLNALERQRTALARILASRPRALLLDDPLSGLDSYEKSRLELELADLLSDFDGPVIWVSNDRGEIYRNCRYACVMEAGQSQELVTAASLFSQPRTETAARLAGCANFADALPRENAVFLPQWGVTLRCAEPLPPFLWRVGIQARHIRPADASTINAFTADVVRVVDDVTSTLLFLRPVGAAEDAPLLRMELDRGVWQSAVERRRMTVTVAPTDILLLR